MNLVMDGGLRKLYRLEGFCWDGLEKKCLRKIDIHCTIVQQTCPQKLALVRPVWLSQDGSSTATMTFMHRKAAASVRFAIVSFPDVMKD